MTLPIDPMLMRGFPDTAESATPGNPAAWLRAFEAAQWRQHYRHHSNTPAAGKPTENDGGDLRATHPKAGPDSRRQDATPPAVMRLTRSTALPEPGRYRAAPMTTDESAGTPATGHAEAWSWPPRLDETQPSSAGFDPLAGVSGPTIRSATVPWRISHVHAMADGTAISVWLRDARIGPEQARDMLAELGRRFARSGLRLALFTLNGKPVTASASHLHT